MLVHGRIRKYSAEVVVVVVVTYRDGQVVTASKLCDLTGVTERSTHDNGVVAVSLIVVENVLHALDAWVLLGGEISLQGILVPIQDSADEGGDQIGACLGSGDGLDEREHEGEVAVDAMLRLQDVGGLDTLPG